MRFIARLRLPGRKGSSETQHHSSRALNQASPLASDGNRHASLARGRHELRIECIRRWDTKHLVAVLGVVLTGACLPAAAAPREILIVTVTTGFRHSSIETGEEVLREIAADNNLAIDFARTAADLEEKMSKTALQRYDAVIFANTTGDLPLPDRDAFLTWIAAGHGFVGIHSASDTFHGFPPYLEMLGGEFDTHGDQTSVHLDVVDRDHPATRGLPETFTIFEEIYEFQRFDPARVRLLVSLDRHPNSGEPGVFPISWSRIHGRGRVFYTALGHREDVWQSALFREHVEGGLLWTMAASRRRPARR